MIKKAPVILRVALALVVALGLFAISIGPAGAALPAADKLTIGTFAAPATINAVGFFKSGSTATIILEIAADPDPNRNNTAKARVTSDSDAVGADATLTETGLSTGILTGTITFYKATTPATAPTAGQVLVNTGDTITVTVAANAVATGSPATAPIVNATAKIDDGKPILAYTAPNVATLLAGGGICEDLNALVDSDLNGTLTDDADMCYIKAATATPGKYTVTGTGTDAVSAVTSVSIASDPASAFETLAGTAVWTVVWALPADGSVTLTATAADTAGNVGTLAQKVKVDNTAPTVTDAAVTPAKAHRGTTTAKVTAKVSDATAGVNTVTVDLAAFGGTATDAMKDDATGGDATANDGIYTATIANVGATDGTFTVTITAKDKAGNSNATAKPSFDVVNDTTAPTAVSFTAAGDISGTTARVADNVNLTVEATDDLSGVAGVTVDATSIGGGAAVALAKTAGTNIWTAQVAVAGGTTAGDKTLTATVTDNAGLKGATKTATATVAAALTTYKLKLAKGWNFVSLPSAPASTFIFELFPDATASKLARISTYDSKNAVWKDAIYDAAKKSWSGSTLAFMEAGKGYFINASEAINVLVALAAVSPLATPPTYDLLEGWNTIGYTSLEIKGFAAPKTYLGGLSVIAFYGFNAATGMPTKLDPASVGDAAAGGVDDMELGKGYWVYLSKAGKLVP